MSKFFKVLLNILVLQSFVLLQGCGHLFAPAERQIVRDSERDVSRNFQQGQVMGKEYELVDEAYLKQLKDSPRVTLDKTRAVSVFVDNAGPRIIPETYLFDKTMPKGTRFRVNRVIVETSVRSQLCTRRIQANLIDEEGHLVSTTDFFGNSVPVYVTGLFDNALGQSEEDWAFIPRAELIKEITHSYELGLE